ncbi:MAG: lipopolysaccharide heptosyltransferase II [Desulfomonile sp.]|nr:lipopolysaccharide heptosyltransferase II [Desulfomonile sp.]
MRADSGPPPIPDSIVVRGTNWVGDTVMSLPAMREVRRIYPDSSITVWVPSNLADLILAAAIADNVMSFDPNRHGAITRPFRMMGRLRQQRFDMAILFQNAFEAAFTVFLAGIPVRAGYPTDLRGPLLTMRAPLTEDIRKKHQVFYYLGITDYLDKVFHGHEPSAARIPDCSILLSVDDLARARDLLTTEKADLRRSVFTLCPGSVNSEAKRWPSDLFARLADLIVDRLDGLVVFLGAPGERNLVESIQAMMATKGAINLAGKADIVTSMSVMQLSRLVVSNDTGSAHLAVAASAKSLTLFGPTIPGATAPFGPNAYIIEGNASCAPCRDFQCPVQGHPCMRSITPEAVLARIEEILSGRVPSGSRPRGGPS